MTPLIVEVCWYYKAPNLHKHRFIKQESTCITLLAFDAIALYCVKWFLNQALHSLFCVFIGEKCLELLMMLLVIWAYQIYKCKRWGHLCASLGSSVIITKDMLIFIYRENSNNCFLSRSRYRQFPTTILCQGAITTHNSSHLRYNKYTHEMPKVAKWVS